MSHFYATINGTAKNPATGRGTKKSGIMTHAASYGGAIRVVADSFPDDESGEVNVFHIDHVPWQNSRGPQVFIAQVMQHGDGTIEVETKEAEDLKKLVKEALSAMIEGVPFKQREKLYAMPQVDALLNACGMSMFPIGGAS